MYKCFWKQTALRVWLLDWKVGHMGGRPVSCWHAKKKDEEEEEEEEENQNFTCKKMTQSNNQSDTNLNGTKGRDKKGRPK